jgi:hypothetical protein
MLVVDGHTCVAACTVCITVILTVTVIAVNQAATWWPLGVYKAVWQRIR